MLFRFFGCLTRQPDAAGLVEQKLEFVALGQTKRLAHHCRNGGLEAIGEGRFGREFGALFVHALKVMHLHYQRKSLLAAVKVANKVWFWA